MISLGVIAALGALIGWGVGDFLVQKLVRRIGNFRTLLYSGSIGFVMTLPFALPFIPDIFTAWQDALLLVGISSIVFFSSAFFNFEALRKGKIAVIAPVLALELPLTVILAVALAGERLTWQQALAMLAIFTGFNFVVHKKLKAGVWRKPLFEKGVAYALVGVLGLAFYNFTIGIASRATEPILTTWIISTTAAVLSFLLLVIRREAHIKELVRPLREMPGLILAESVMFVGAGLCFAFATTHIPISVATGVSEGYVALAVILGLVFNREKLNRMQFVGIAILVVGIAALALITK